MQQWTRTPLTVQMGASRGIGEFLKGHVRTDHPNKARNLRPRTCIPQLPAKQDTPTTTHVQTQEGLGAVVPPLQMKESVVKIPGSGKGARHWGKVDV